jgi:hypothetical protein
MRTPPLALVASALLVSLAGCTETPTPAAPTPPVATVAADTAAPVAGDLSPVAEPSDVIGFARWKSPLATFGHIASCGGTPQVAIEVGSRAALDLVFSEAFRRVADGRALARAVNLDAPAASVVALDPSTRSFQAMAAFSIGLTGLDKARAAVEAKGSLAEIAPGLYRMSGKVGDLVCAIGPSAGPAPAQLVCGGREKDLIALAPYLARTVPTLPPPASELHAELRFRPLEARFGGDIRNGLAFLPVAAQRYTIGEPRFDRAVIAAANALSAEGAALTGDLDKVTLDLGADPNACLTLSAALDLRGTASWTAETLALGGSHAGAPPAIYWRAPKDSDSAYYTRGGDPARVTRMLGVLRDLAEGGLARANVGSDDDRRALASLVRPMLGKDAHTVVAAGNAAPAAPAKPKDKANPQDAARNVMNAALGWYLVGIDEGPDAMSKWLKDFVGVYNRPSIRDALKKRLGRDADVLPTLKLVAAPAKLGRGALDVEIKVEGPVKRKGDGEKKGKGDKVSLAMHVLLMADGKNTWVAVGVDRDALVSRLLAARSGAPDAGTIASRASLEPLRSGKAVSSGYVTLGVLTKALHNLAGVVIADLGPLSQELGMRKLERYTQQLEEVQRALGNLPNKGETPMFFRHTVAAGDAPHVQLDFSVQKGSVEDLGSILGTVARMAGGALPAPPPPTP